MPPLHQALLRWRRKKRGKVTLFLGNRKVIPLPAFQRSWGGGKELYPKGEFMAPDGSASVLLKTAGITIQKMRGWSADHPLTKTLSALPTAALQVDTCAAGYYPPAAPHKSPLAKKTHKSGLLSVRLAALAAPKHLPPPTCTALLPTSQSRRSPKKD